MRIGIFAKTFAGTDAASVLTAARAAGYSAVQFNMACVGLPSMPDAIEPACAASIGDAARAAEITIAAMSGTYNMIHPDPTVRARGLRRLEVLAAAAHRMGTRLITLCTGTRDAADQWRHHPDNATSEAWSDLLFAMRQAIVIADHHDVELGVEPELANVVDSAGKARHLLDELASPRVRIVLDPANLFEVATSEARHRIVADAVDLLAGDIAMAHAKDRRADGAFASAGSGVIDFRHFLATLDATGFRGPLITHGLEAAEAPRVAAFLTRIHDEIGR